MGIYQSDLPPDFAYVPGGPWCKIKQIVNEKASDKMRTRTKMKNVASDCARREEVPRYILFYKAVI